MIIHGPGRYFVEDMVVDVLYWRYQITSLSILVGSEIGFFTVLDKSSITVSMRGAVCERHVLTFRSHFKRWIIHIGFEASVVGDGFSIETVWIAWNRDSSSNSVCPSVIEGSLSSPKEIEP